MFIEQKRLRSDLHIFLALVITLLIIGFLFIYSASSVFALEKCGSAHYFVKKQFIGLAFGIVGLLLFRFLPLEFLRSMSPLFFWTSFGLTALTLIPGFAYKIHGSSRWLHCGPLSFQPSELLKISLIMYIAYLINKQESQYATGTYRYIPFLILLSFSCIVLLKQPDFGMAFTLASTILLLLFMMHINTKHIIFVALSTIPVGLLLIITKSYRLKRIMTFFNPWNDPQGAGFQLIQSLIAIGSGSWLGVGVSNSKQKFFYLPMQHTDFIFSIIAEETGFIGASLLILLYILFLYIGMRMAWHMKNIFSIVVTLGFVIMISMQALINLAVTTGLIPTKGIGLPFVSYGNSALICGLCMVGLIMNCVAESRG
jgi:cell division protein FtsW